MNEFTVLKIVTLVCGTLALLFIAIGTFSPAWIILTVKTDFGGQPMSSEIDIGLFTAVACVNSGAGEMCKTVTMTEIEDAVTGGQAELNSMKVMFGNINPVKALMMCGLAFIVLGLVGLFLYFRDVKAYGPTRKRMGIYSTMAWGIAAILVLAAVAAEGHQNTNMSNSLDVIKSALKSASKMLSGYDRATTPLSTYDQAGLNNWGDTDLNNGGNDAFGLNDMQNKLLQATNTNNIDVASVLNSIDIDVLCPWAIVLSGIGACFCLFVELFMGLWLCKRQDDSGEWHEFSNQTQQQP